MALGLRDHFRPGQGCLREVAAYIMDRDNFCGVPPTALIHCQHPLFSYPTTGGKRKLFPKLGSLQQFVRASECFDDLGPGQFSDFEIQKIALLDLRLLNCDRNAANMLVRYKRHVSSGSGSSDGNIDINGQSEGSLSNSDGDWINDSSPTSDTPDMYEVIPIDHGYCMPSKLHIDEFDLAWFTLPQVKNEVHPAIKEYVASLDFEPMLYNVLEQISLPGNSIFLLALAHLLVTQGIASGLTLYEIATLVARVNDEQASKLEQAIEEAEENAFRAIEMKSKRISSNPSLQPNNYNPSKSASGPMLKKAIVNISGGQSPPKNIDICKSSTVSPSPADNLHHIPLSTSMGDLKNIEKPIFTDLGVDTTSKVSPSEATITKNIKTVGVPIGYDGVWDLKSIAACASPSASVLKALNPPSAQGLKPNGITSISSTVGSSKVTRQVHQPSPLELGSDFLSDIILAACTDEDCEVAFGSPSKLSPKVYSPTKASKVVHSSPLGKDVEFFAPMDQYLPPIEEERRMRGGSTGSTCSSTDNGGADQPVVDTVLVREPSIHAKVSESTSRHIGTSLAEASRVGFSRGNGLLNNMLPLSVPTSSNIMLTSPKFISALSNLHGSQLIEDNSSSIDMLHTLPLQGSALSRMRSVDQSVRSKLPNSLFSASTDSFSGISTATDSTFEAAGTGFEIDIDNDNIDSPKRLEGHVEISIADRASCGQIESELMIDRVPKKGSDDPSNSSFSDMVSPLARILAVPSDPNLSTSLLETCMTAGGNMIEPIEQPSLRKFPPNFDLDHETNRMPPPVVKAGSTNSPFQVEAAIINGFTTHLTPQRKRKHDSFTSDNKADVVTGESEKNRRPYQTPSPCSRHRQSSESSNLHQGSKSAALTSDKTKRWLTDEESRTNITEVVVARVIDDDLSNAPSMNRVASFSGFESAPIYDFQAEGRFGSLRQEKRKVIMKTPEFNKFRLHFAHEAVLSIINRLLKQKQQAAEKSEKQARGGK